MTEHEVEEVAQAMENLKRARTLNDPLIAGFLSHRSWISLSLFGAIGLTLFCLPGQILLAAYGGFRWIPPEYKAILGVLLALVLVCGGAWKAIILICQANSGEKGQNSIAAFASVIRIVFRGKSMHIAIPALAAAATLVLFFCLIGHPWYTVSFIAIMLCFWLNFLGVLISRKDLVGMGWWSLATGLASLFFVESAPLIWLFIIYGGLLYIFAGVTIANRHKNRATPR